jgi:hypothetical protein
LSGTAVTIGDHHGSRNAEPQSGGDQQLAGEAACCPTIPCA